MGKTIVGLYPSFKEARKVQAKLITAGFDNDNISILAANSDDRYSEFVERSLNESDYAAYGRESAARSEADDDRAGEAAIAGGVIGGVGAAILAVFIPGIGPFTATGWLLAGLIGLVSGAVTGGLLGALLEAGIDEEDAAAYSEGVRRGYALVTVRAQDEDSEPIAAIMNEQEVIDIDERSAYWRSQGWNGSFDDEAAVYGTDDIEREHAGYGEYVTARATERDSAAAFDDGDRVTTAASKAAHTDANTAVAKREGNGADYGNVEHQAHFQTTYADTGHDYSYYAPHYQYGHALGAHPTYAGRDWSTIEPEVRRDWEQRNTNDDTHWEDVKEAVHSSWISAKRTLA